MMGPMQNLLLISDMQEIEDVRWRGGRHALSWQICIRRAKEFERADLSTVTFRHTMPTGLISLKTNDVFKRHKRVLAPAMTSTCPSLRRIELTDLADLSNFTPRITACLQDLLNLFDIQRQLAGDKPFAVKHAIVTSILDISSAVAFGETMQSIASQTAIARGLDHAPPPNERGGIVFPAEDTALARDIEHLFAVRVPLRVER